MAVAYTDWWDFLGQIYVLCDGLVTLYRAFLLNVLQLVADIRLLIDDTYQAILDREVNVGTFLDFLCEVALGFDSQLFATVVRLAKGLISAADGARAHGEGGFGVRSTYLMSKL